MGYFTQGFSAYPVNAAYTDWTYISYYFRLINNFFIAPEFCQGFPD